MGLFDIFTPAPTAPTAPTLPVQPTAPTGVTAAPGQPGNIPAPEVVAVPAAVPAELEVPDSPLAPFEKLWEDVPIDPNAPVPTVPAELKAEDVQKVMAGANFVPQITDEQKAAIAAGGEGAQEAFNAALNSVAQQVMTQATLVGNKLNENQIAAAIERHMSNLPDMLREQGSAEHLKTSNPLFDNPAVKPVVEATRQQLLQKFPNATHAEITTMTQDFILAMGESFSPPPESTAPGETDWNNFLD